MSNFDNNTAASSGFISKEPTVCIHIVSAPELIFNIAIILLITSSIRVRLFTIFSIFIFLFLREVVISIRFFNLSSNSDTLLTS